MNSFILSDEFNISVSLFSLFLGIVFFWYQEYRQRKAVDRETIRVTEEFVNLIIRNCVNKKILLSDIDLSFMLEGLVLIKNCDLKYNLQEVVKMVYARVYENEHISDEVRKNLLREIEQYLNELLSNYEYLNKEKYQPTIRSIFLSFSMVAVGIVVPLIINKYAYIESNSLVFTLVLSVLVVFTSMFTARTIKLLFLFFNDKKTQSKPQPKSRPPEIPPPSQISQDTNTNEVHLSNLIRNENIVIEVFKQRFIFEYLIEEVNVHIVPEEKQQWLPFHRKVGMLRERGIITIELSDTLISLYRWSSAIMHGRELHYHDGYYEDNIQQMKIASTHLNKYIKKL